MTTHGSEKRDFSEDLANRQNDASSFGDNFQVHQLYFDFRFTSCNMRRAEPDQLDFGNLRDLFGRYADKDGISPFPYIDRDKYQREADRDGSKLPDRGDGHGHCRDKDEQGKDSDRGDRPVMPPVFPDWPVRPPVFPHRPVMPPVLPDKLPVKPDRDGEGKGCDGKDRDGKDSDGKGNDGKGNDGKGSDGKGNDGKGSDGKGNDGKGSDGKGNDGKGGDGKDTDGKGGDGKRLNTFLDDVSGKQFEVSPLAKAALDDKPNPIDLVQLEHHLPGQQVWEDSKKSLEDMPKMKDLSFAYQATKDEKYAEKTKEFMVAWATNNKSVGNPINDEQLLPLVHAYGLVKDSAAMKNDPQATKKIEDYMRDIAQQNQNTYDKPKNGPQSNWQAHRVEIIGDIGFVLGDKQLIDKSIDNFKTYVGNGSITEDGSHVDFKIRDAIYYHNYAINPLLRLAKVMENNGYPNLFKWEAPNGASLKKAVDFEIPYVTGEKKHMEFVNSIIEHDRNRAKLGLKTYIPHYWEPKKSERLFQNAKALDPSYAAFDKYFA